MPLRCKVFAILNDCSNWDEVDVTFVQTQKSQSLIWPLTLSHTFTCMNICYPTVSASLCLVEDLSLVELHLYNGSQSKILYYIILSLRWYNLVFQFLLKITFFFFFSFLLLLFFFFFFFVFSKSGFVLTKLCMLTLSCLPIYPVSSLTVFYHKMGYHNDLHISLEVLKELQPNFTEMWLRHQAFIKR